MSIDFNIKEFFHPIKILKLHYQMGNNHNLPIEKQKINQEKKIHDILEHAYRNIPYYTDLFDENGINPKNIKGLGDLCEIPIMTKKDLHENFDRLKPKNINKFNPVEYQTTGTTGIPTRFLLDSSSNALEFCYYWRYWSWAGYKIGDSFGELALQHFVNKDTIDDIFSYNRLTNRLIINPIQLSKNNIPKIVSQLKSKKCKFLKGSPTTIFEFCRNIREDEISFKNVFTTGEMLLPQQRKEIEKKIGCSVIDSYGHMERTVAICQCPHGKYHINTDYGLLEIDENKKLSDNTHKIGEVIGTSLHNLAMPLLRYQVGDLVSIPRNQEECECGTRFPICDGIFGRNQDVIITPDGRYLTNLFILFNMLEGVRWVQIIQEHDVITVCIVKEYNFSQEKEDEFLKKLKKMVGEDMTVKRKYLEKPPKEKKYTPIISRVKK